MVDIIRLHGDPHHQTRILLPWYLNGTLDADEAALVEAHLADCAECRAELDAERRLTAELTSLPPELDPVWSSIRSTIEAAPRAPAPVRRFAPRRILRRPVSLGWALAAQAASLAVIVVLVWLATSPADPSPAYRTLSAPPSAAAAGNVVVIFEPTTSEDAMRTALRASGARLVDGPTASDAYILHVPVERREAALAQLRADGQVVLAEPIDGILQP